MLADAGDEGGYVRGWYVPGNLPGSVAGPGRSGEPQGGSAGQAVNSLDGRVSSIVYIGTDTQYGVTLPGGQELRVREQNSSPESRLLAKEGEPVTVRFTADAARVLTE